MLRVVQLVLDFDSLALRGGHDITIVHHNGLDCANFQRNSLDLTIGPGVHKRQTIRVKLLTIDIILLNQIAFQRNSLNRGLLEVGVDNHVAVDLVGEGVILDLHSLGLVVCNNFHLLKGVVVGVLQREGNFLTVLGRVVGRSDRSGSGNLRRAIQSRLDTVSQYIQGDCDGAVGAQLFHLYNVRRVLRLVVRNDLSVANLHGLNVVAFRSGDSKLDIPAAIHFDGSLLVNGVSAAANFHGNLVGFRLAALVVILVVICLVVVGIGPDNVAGGTAVGATVGRAAGRRFPIPILTTRQHAGCHAGRQQQRETFFCVHMLSSLQNFEFRSGVR